MVPGFENHFPSGSLAIGIAFDGFLDFGGQILFLAPIVVSGSIVVEVYGFLFVLCEIGEEIIRQFPQEGRREYVEGFEASKDVSVVLCHDHRLHIPEIHSHVEGALGIEITEDAAIFPIPQSECVLY